MIFIDLDLGILIFLIFLALLGRLGVMVAVGVLAGALFCDGGDSTRVIGLVRGFPLNLVLIGDLIFFTVKGMVVS